jgi:hypothetical protein
MFAARHTRISNGLASTLAKCMSPMRKNGAKHLEMPMSAAAGAQPPAGP